MSPDYRSNQNPTDELREPAAAYGGPHGTVVLYQDPDGKVTLDVRLDRDTLWLNQKQMAELFATERSVITKHLRNIFKSGELEKEAVCAKFAHTASDGKTYQVTFYNLDAIISVGYRVNSKRGTQFRIWATQVLRDHILKGYTVNARRLAELQQAVRLVAHVADRRMLTTDEARALLRVIGDYTYALDLLDDFDHGRLPKPGKGTPTARPIDYEEAKRLILTLRERFGGGSLFGREKDEGLKSALAAIFQTAGGHDVYPSLEEMAAHLLYFVVKNHAFVDGNKRIGAALFLWFLEKNHALYRENGERRLSDETLVALTLLIAESPPAEKDVIVRLTTFLLQGITSMAREET